MSKISAKRKSRAIAFYIGVVVVLALVWMNWGAISHGIILLLDNLFGTVDSLSGG